MEIFLKYFIPFTMSFIMFGIGLNLQLEDFKRVFLRPKGILFGLFGQLILMPSFGILVAYLSPIDPIYKLGIVLITACPGGMSSNLITYLLRGRVALSVSITAFNSFLIIFSIPLFIHFGSQLFLANDQLVQLSLFDTFYEISLTVIIPIILGMIANQKLKGFSNILKPKLKWLLPSLLFITFALVLFTEENKSPEVHFSMSLTYLILIVFIINIGIMIIGFISSGWIGMNNQGRMTIAIEFGLQNTALAIFLAHQVLKIPDLATISVIYGSFSFFTTFGVAYLMKKNSKPAW